METHAVSFLGKTYRIPSAAKQYADYEADMVHYLAELIHMVSVNIDRDMNAGPKSWIDHASEDLEAYAAKMTEITAAHVKLLVENGIYDVGPDTLLEGVSSFDDLGNFSIRTVKSTLDRVRRIADAQETGLRYAHNAAASNISGSGITVFTSNMAVLASCAIAEGSVLMRQKSRAEREFRTAAEKLSRQAASAIDKVCYHAMIEEYYPGLPLIFGDFWRQVSKKFLCEMVLHEKFDFDSIAQYNGRRAEDMLDNLDFTSDKKTLLEQSFLMCPFNPRVYQECLNEGLMDINTYETARYFRADDELNDKIDKACMDMVESENAFERVINLYATIENIEKDAAAEKLFDRKIKQALKYAGKRENTAGSDDALGIWIASNLCSCASELCDRSNEAIASEVSAIMHATTDSRLVEEIENRCRAFRAAFLKDTSPDASAREIAASAMAMAVVSYARQLRSKVEAIDTEIERIRSLWEERSRLIENARAECGKAINALSDERSSLGLFSFGKKKGIDNEIERLRCELKSFEDSCHLGEITVLLDALKQKRDEIPLDSATDIDESAICFEEQIEKPEFKDERH
ncbi:MAG: hypothetical protein Q4B69_06375 [Slackia sp.]|nr:hypothetical protein [Slackia sp.]